MMIVQRAALAGVNLYSNYRGDLSDSRIENAVVPEHENCAVHWTKIHPLASLREIFGFIRAGKVYQFSYSPPQALHTTAAARLVFFKRAEADAFIDQCCNAERGIVIRGQRTNAIFNRDKGGPRPEWEYYQTRVSSSLQHLLILN